MSNSDGLSILLEDLESTNSLEELQAHVMLANAHFEDQPSIELPETTAKASPQIAGDLEQWLERLRERLDDLASAQSAASYSISMSGDLTGPSVSVSVTFQVEPSTE
ncbi:hypothetical protein [Halostagnicola sp. A-GB9-2]|uniref:hypothetical protein n=1 Tax=Halostagnicola sp. A-GB9-2 TaxID=3048066 RepID=UPI0024C06AE5|nr:hypothetical protein [Halostagnicola sp. A-GB9-2]MDJ1431891.1 hypothetical protein [Halostagnicola sp. A-GB9-2]